VMFFIVLTQRVGSGLVGDGLWNVQSSMVGRLILY